MANLEVFPDDEHAQGNPFVAQIGAFHSLEDEAGTICVRPPISFSKNYLGYLGADAGFELRHDYSTSYGTMIDYRVSNSEYEESVQVRVTKIARSLLHDAGLTASKEMFQRFYEITNKEQA